MGVNFPEEKKLHKTSMTPLTVFTSQHEIESSASGRIANHFQAIFRAISQCKFSEQKIGGNKKYCFCNYSCP